MRSVRLQADVTVRLKPDTTTWRYTRLVTIRKQLMDMLAREPRSVSSLAREIGLPRADVADALLHMITSARAAGHRIVVIPARCRSCGFSFGEDRLTRPSKCPKCRNSRIFEPQIGVDTADPTT